MVLLFALVSGGHVPVKTAGLFAVSGYSRHLFSPPNVLPCQKEGLASAISNLASQGDGFLIWREGSWIWEEEDSFTQANLKAQGVRVHSVLMHPK